MLAMHALTRTEDDHVWGVCPTVEGLYGDPERGTYELRGWVPDGAGAREGWLGESVWLVPADDERGRSPWEHPEHPEPAGYREHDAWLLTDAEAVRVTGDLVLTGEDDHMGPPESHRGPVRLHDGRRWLGSCEEFTRVQPAPVPVPRSSCAAWSRASGCGRPWRRGPGGRWNWNRSSWSCGTGGASR